MSQLSNEELVKVMRIAMENEPNFALKILLGMAAERIEQLSNNQKTGV